MASSPWGAGHARTDITPDRTCPLLGYDQRADYFPERGNAGMHDPLSADVLVIGDGTQRMVLVTLDLCILENPVARHLAAVVGRAAGVSPEKVILACSHTHSGPYPWWKDEPPNEPVPGSLLCGASARYTEILEERLTPCVLKAAADFQPARLRFRAASLTLGYTRRVPRADGSIGMAWDLREWDGPPPRPADDPSFGVLMLERDGGNLLVWNAAAHPVVLGKRSNLVSADWPGAARATIENRLPGTRALFLHGAGGDVHPWKATGDHAGDLAPVAAPAADLAVLLAEADSGTPDDPGVAGHALAVVSATIPTPGATVEIKAARLGPVRLLAVPVELFGRTGARLHRDYPDLLLATTAGGWEGYWPLEECFAEGGYEIDAALGMDRHPGDTEVLLRAATGLLDQI